MVRAVTVFMWAWVALDLAVNALAIVGLVIGGPTLQEGWENVAAVFNPLNVVNVLWQLLLVSPAVVAAFWREHLRRKQPTPDPAP